MLAKARRAIVAVTLMVMAFGVTSYALSATDDPRFRGDLPAADLPSLSLDEAEKLRVSNLIGATGTTRYGIVPESFDNVKILAQTTAGNLYAIPGSDGVCLALADSVSCGNPGVGEERFVALVRQAASGRMVGGGITTDSVRFITIGMRGHTQSIAVKEGVFVVSDGARINPEPLEFEAHVK